MILPALICFIADLAYYSESIRTQLPFTFCASRATSGSARSLFLVLPRPSLPLSLPRGERSFHLDGRTEGDTEGGRKGGGCGSRSGGAAARRRRRLGHRGWLLAEGGSDSNGAEERMRHSPADETDKTCRPRQAERG